MTVDGVEGSGRICSASQYDCHLELYAQNEGGDSIRLQATTIAWGVTFPYTYEFAGSADIAKVVSVRAVVYGHGGTLNSDWKSITDPIIEPVVSVSPVSVGRDSSSGFLTFDVNVAVDGVQGVGRICSSSQYDCHLTLYAQYVNGGVNQLQATTIAWGAAFPYTHEFSGTVDFAKIVSVRGVINGHGGSLTGDWEPVDDPLSNATSGTGSVSVSVGSIGRDTSTGGFTYELSVSVSGAALSEGPCGGHAYNCYLNVQTLSESGSIGNLASRKITDLSNHSESFVGTSPRTKTVAIRAYTTGYYAPGPFYSEWVSVSDAYPERSVSVAPTSFGRDASTGTLWYSLSVFLRGAALLDGPCGGQAYNCYIHVQTLSQSGSIGNLIYSKILDVSNHTETFTGSTSAIKITAIRVYTTGYYAPGPFYSDWVPVHDQDKSESAGGGNPAEKGCQCHNGDPVNTQTGEFYETVTDLGVPGVGPAVAVGRTYSALSAAVDGPFGYGTTSNFNSRLVVDTAGDSSDPLPRLVHIVQENGATVPFSEANDGTYPAAPWVLATLTHSSSTGNWTFTRDKKQVLVFDSSGALISTSDLYGNTVTYGHTSGNVTSISGAGGRSVDLTWSSGRVSSIEDSAGRTVSYSYDTSGNLAVVHAADSGIWAYTYDSSHRLLTETKPGGGVTTNVYNSTGQVTSQTDPVGRVTAFSYSGATTAVTLPDGSVTTYTFNQGQPASITTATGTALAATTTYSYDAEGNRISDTDPLGHTTSYTYDSAGNALTTTDPLGKVTTRTFDALRDVTSVTDPLGRSTTMTYNSNGDMTSMTTPGGHTSSWVMNANGTIASSTDARSKTTSFTYDSAGQALCVTDPDSRQTCQSNDSRGLPTSKTAADGKVTNVTYDDAGRVLTVTDPNSHATTYQYDADGNRTSTKDASGNTATATFDAAGQRTSSTDGRGKTTAFTYTPRGSLATATDPNGHVTTNAFDALNRLVSSTDAESRVTSFGYDLAGHRTSITLPSSAATSSTFDADGRVATTTDARGKVTHYAYDAAGQLASTTDPLGRATSYSYTQDGKLHVTTLPDMSTEIHAYNEAGVQTSFTNADGEIASYAYDDAGLLSSETQPGSMITSYSYDSAGRIHSVTTPDGVVATRSYDDGGRLTGIDYPGTASDVSYTYYANDTRHTMTDGTGTTTYAYNANSALTSVQNGNGQTVGYGYDDASQLTSLTYPGAHTVSYGYDNAGNMTSVTDWASRTTTLTVTPDGLQNTRSDPSGVTESRSYNANNQLTDISSATSSATLSSYGYGYDDAGQLTSSTVTDALHTTTVAKNWGYTALGQLSSTSSTEGFSTTSAGKLTATPSGDAFTYNSKQELTSASNTGYGTTFGYDDNGSRTSATTTYTSAPTATAAYSYDARGNLASVTIGGTTVSYSSDGNGLRQSRTVGAATKQFVWDPNRSVPLLLDDGDHSYIYATGTTPIAQIDDVTGAIEYLHADNIGSVRTITDDAGAVVSTMDYGPYGAQGTHLGASTSAFGFASAWTDPASGTDYLRAREYDPVTGQFLQVDPAVNVTREPYAYVAGDPLASVDPLGLCKGMDGTPQDRVCLGWDYFMESLPSVVSNSVKPTFAGLAAGSTFGIGLLTNNDQACYGNDLWFKISYGLGVAGSAVGILAGGEALAGAKVAEGYSGVSAADSGGAGFLRHYTTDSAAESISKSGTIKPGIANGKIWLTTDEYATGTDAQAGLALRTTPDGYYEIPICRVRCAFGPSPVEPDFPYPGGGSEITTTYPIDVSNLPFLRFGG